ncbi:MAG: NAD(P)/FAD-dependent oxidoreductase [Anaerolineales bacterium]
MKTDEVAIIGAGPAGTTAAIQLKRYGIPFVLLERERVGGLLWNANLVENYPGFPAGVSGPKLIHLIEKQMERIGVEVTFDSVSRLQYGRSGFHIKTIRAEYNPRYVIVASGTRPNPIPLAIPDRAQGRVFSDVYHLLDETQKRIVIVGAGDAAFDYALNLTKNRNSVTILNRGGGVQCLRLLWERAMVEPAIEYHAETPVRAVEVDETLPERGGETGNRFRVRTEAGESFEADYLLFAIGRVPQTDFLSAELVDQHIKGLYFVGDVRNGLYRQAAIAAGDGLRAAMDIYFKFNSEA